MELAKVRKKNLQEGYEEKIGFRIEASAKAFEILYSKLYKYPKKAIVRELSTNAYDSHVANGNPDESFEVHLPNNLEPYFYVRDFGAGLSREEIKELYTVLFASNKTDSNDAVGCLGLGSKSPFSYTDSFIVESIYHGKRYLYTAFIDDETGKPCLSVLDGDGEDTTERSGLKVTIPVQTYDFNEFVTNASNIYQYFEVKPIIKGRQGYVIPSLEYEASHNSWSIRSIYNGSANVIMGNICYPVNISDAAGQFSQTAKNVLTSPIDIRVPIGEVSIEASREGLHLNKSTIARLEHYAEIVTKELEPIIADKIKNCPNMWRARLMAEKVVRSLKGNLGNCIKWNDIRFNGELVYNGGRQPIQFPKLSDASVSQFSHGRRESFLPDWIYPEETMKFVIGDMKAGSITRTQKLSKDTNCKVFLCKFASAADEKTFNDALGIDKSEFIAASTLPSNTVRQASGKMKKGKTARLLTLNKNSSGKSDFWKDEQHTNLDDGGIYVEVNRYDCLENEAIISQQEVRKIIKLLEDNGHTIPTLYGVRSALKKKVIKHKKWESLFDFARKKLENLYSSFNYREIIHSGQTLYQLEYNAPMSYSNMYKVADMVESDSPLKELMEYWKKTKLSEVKMNNARLMQSVNKVLKIKELPFDEDNSRLNELVEKVNERYTLLVGIPDYTISDYLEDVAVYIKAVDLMEKN